MKIGLNCFVFMMAALANADDIPQYISAAVANPNRPDIDRQRDADRKPAEVIAFAGLKPGDKVADFLPGKGYFTKIFCKVVGDAGHVYAVSVPPISAANNAAIADSGMQPISDDCTNVTASTLRPRSFPAPELHSDSDDPGWVYEYWAQRLPVESFVSAEPLDMIWTAENYHDLHNKRFGSPRMSWVNSALLIALKPGGVLIVEDHAAQAGSGARDTETLHRIDAQQVKEELIAAGFEFIGESKVLHNADDPHTSKAHGMHDKTDRFLFKFRKP